MIVPDDEQAYWDQVFNFPRPVRSVLNDREKLAFHILAEIKNRIITGSDDMFAWYRRSLAFRQGTGPFTEVEARPVLGDLQRMGMVRENESGVFHATGLGYVCAVMYYSPYDIRQWFENFSFLYAHDRAFDDISLAWAIANVPSGSRDYLESRIKRTLLGVHPQVPQEEPVSGH